MPITPVRKGGAWVAAEKNGEYFLTQQHAGNKQKCEKPAITQYKKREGGREFPAYFFINTEQAAPNKPARAGAAFI